MIRVVIVLGHVDCRIGGAARVIVDIVRIAVDPRVTVHEAHDVQIDVDLARIHHLHEVLVEVAVEIAAAGAHEVHVDSHGGHALHRLVIAVLRHEQASELAGLRRLHLGVLERGLRCGLLVRRLLLPGGTRVRVAIDGDAGDGDECDEHHGDHDADDRLCSAFLLQSLALGLYACLLLLPALSPAFPFRLLRICGHARPFLTLSSLWQRPCFGNRVQLRHSGEGELGSRLVRASRYGGFTDALREARLPDMRCSWEEKLGPRIFFPVRCLFAGRKYAGSIFLRR